MPIKKYKPMTPGRRGMTTLAKMKSQHLNQKKVC